AQKMKQADCGFLPVGDNNQPIGIITDRDIVIRAIADGKTPTEARVRDYMTDDVCSCKDSDSLADAAHVMSEHKVSRLLVNDASGAICGVLTFGRLIRNNDNRAETSEVVDAATGMAA
ncbi:MAG TPA: CBS domain-containing protein, partial [Micavibrio sp.]